MSLFYKIDNNTAANAFEQFFNRKDHSNSTSWQTALECAHC